MKPKQLLFHDSAREKIRRGMDALAEAVKVGRFTAALSIADVTSISIRYTDPTLATRLEEYARTSRASSVDHDHPAPGAVNVTYDPHAAGTLAARLVITPNVSAAAAVYTVAATFGPPPPPVSS